MFNHAIVKYPTDSLMIRTLVLADLEIMSHFVKSGALAKT